MNERIKALMPKPWTFPYPDRELYTKEQLEHFAELIVRECCFTGEQYAEGLIDPAHYAFINKKIKEHFGVE